MKTAKNIVKMLLLGILVSLGILAVPTPAMALNLAVPRTVWIQGTGGDDFVPGGTWTLLDLELNITGYCRYTVEWRSTGPDGLTITGNVYLDERKTLGHADCTENSMQDFNTSISLAPAPGTPSSPPSYGPNRFRQRQRISMLSLSESDETTPRLRGTVQFLTGSPVGIEM